MPKRTRLEWNDPDLQIEKRTKKPLKSATVLAQERLAREKKKNKKLTFDFLHEREEKIKAKEARDKAKNTKRYAVARQHLRTKISERNIAKWAIKQNHFKRYAFANELITRRITNEQLTNSMFLDGISAFPIIFNWCRTHKIDTTTFSIFILMSHYEMFYPVDGMYFGYSQPLTVRHIKKLVQLQLAEEMEHIKKCYNTTMLGKQTFAEFKKYFTKTKRELVRNFKDTFNPTDDPLLFKKQRLTLAKRRRHDDQQKAQDGNTGS